MLTAEFAHDQAQKVIEYRKNSQLNILFDKIDNAMKRGLFEIESYYINDVAENKLNSLGYTVIQNQGNVPSRIMWKNPKHIDDNVIIS